MREVGVVPTPCNGLRPGTHLAAEPEEAAGLGCIQRVVFSTPDHVWVEALQLIGQGPPAEVERHAVDDVHLDAGLLKQRPGQGG